MIVLPGDTAAPAVWFAYSPDRKGEHPAQHLEKFRGTLQADAYAGFNQLYEDGRIQQAACWAHVRRKFYDLEQAHSSPVAREALQRIGALYGIEETDSRSSRRTNAEQSARRKPSRCWTLCDSGSRRPCRSSRASRRRRWRFATRFRAGTR